LWIYIRYKVIPETVDTPGVGGADGRTSIPELGLEQKTTGGLEAARTRGSGAEGVAAAAGTAGSQAAVLAGLDRGESTGDRGAGGEETERARHFLVDVFVCVIE
jgi:hypothetical protein